MLDRRALIGGAFALSATPVIAFQASRTHSLAEMLSDYRWAVEAHAAALEYFDDLHENMLPPIPEIRFGRRRVADAETGAISFIRWSANYPQQIEKHFEPLMRVMFGPKQQLARVKARKARLMRKLTAKWAAWEHVRVDSGVAAAENAELAADMEVLRLKREIFAYRPESPAEAASKADFVLNHMTTWPLNQDEIATILRSMAPLPKEAA